MKKNYNHKQARWLLVVATLLALFVARPVKAEDNVYNGDGYSLKYIAIKNPPEGEEKRAIVIGLTDGTLDYTGHVNIPSKIENLPVRHIGVYDRMSNRVGFPKVSSIDIPSSVRTIGRGSFYGNSNLTNVKIARGGLTEILSEAFRGCVALKNIELPTTLIDLSAMENSMARMMLETINNMMIELYASMAQAEIEKKEKRQREGIEQKKARGEWDDYGRPRVMDLEEFATHYRLVQQGEKKPFELMKELGMTKPTFYRYKNQIEKGC